jgi:PAS domain S-box-containing protein
MNRLVVAAKKAQVWTRHSCRSVSSSTTSASVVGVPNYLSFATPESDFCAAPKLQFHKKQDTTSTYAVDYNALSTPYTATGEPLVCAVPAPRYQQPLLPTTLAQALCDPTYQNAALVVTTATSPFRIVHVNQAWTKLCGFSQEQVLHQSLSVIQGPKSDVDQVKRMIAQVQSTRHEQETFVINYTSQGVEFMNHLRVGPLVLDSVELLVGILQNVDVAPAPDCELA